MYEPTLTSSCTWTLQIPLGVTCLGHVPSDMPPLLRLSYTVGGRQVAQELRLPITSSKFMVPEPGEGATLTCGSARHMHAQ